jgi:CubicO group peptidase (beta-lactamase class C family)
MLRTFPPSVSIPAVATVALVLALTTVPVEAQEAPVQPGGPPTVPLHLAALQGDADAIGQHVAAGSDLDQLDAYGATPLIVATTFGRAAAARALIEAGADPTIANADGSTPLHIAAFLGRRDIVELLLRHGADRDLRDDDGASAYDLAVVPVEIDRPVLDQLRTALGPLGLELDDGRVADGRTPIVGLLHRPPDELSGVDFRPRPGVGWPVSTPAERGLDPALVASLYADASELDAIRGLLILKDGHLVAERYFNEGAVDRPTLVQSVTKSVTSALVGIALDRGCLEGIDQRMLDFFPERAAEIRDPRKREITVRHMLQMRAGYGYEGTDSVRWEGLIGGDYLPLMVEFPLDRAPGSGFDYSNLTSHLLGVIVARSCGTDLLPFAEQHLFDPIGVQPGEWRTDPDGYRYGYAGLFLTAQDMARFGLLYLDDGVWEGRQVVPADWVEASLTGYSSTLDSPMLPTAAIGRYFRDAEYGYQWWSARVDGRRLDFAWGYGGQLIVLLRDLDMVLVVTTDPFEGQTRRVYEARKDEQASFNVVGKFIQALPEPGAES